MNASMGSLRVLAWHSLATLLSSVGNVVSVVIFLDLKKVFELETMKGVRDKLLATSGAGLPRSPF